MKTIFVINPKAGKGKGLKEFAASVRQTAERLDIPVNELETKYPLLLAKKKNKNLILYIMKFPKNQF